MTKKKFRNNGCMFGKAAGKNLRDWGKKYQVWRTHGKHGNKLTLKLNYAYKAMAVILEEILDC